MSKFQNLFIRMGFYIHGHDQRAVVHGVVADQDAAAVDDQFEVLHIVARIHVEFVSG
jgi:hypothetical protein